MLKKDVLFSIITVSYNSELFIHDAIISILSSTFLNFELIIIDDCSSDNTWGIINKFDDKRIKKVRNKQNIGEYQNRNKALALAEGDWILYIDGDDFLYPHGLSFLNEMINKYSDVGMLLMRWYRNNMIYPVIITPRDFYLEQYFGEGFLATAFTNVLFKREVLVKNGGIPTAFSFGDDYIRMKIALSNNIMIVSDQLTFWRETPNQAFQVKKELLESYFETLNTKYFFLEEALKTKIITANEFEFAKYKLSNIIKRKIVRMIFSLKIVNSFKIFLRLKSKLLFFKSNQVIHLPLSEYSPINLLTFDKSISRLND
jgi:glycosyltransferase involved in cell wall biosynthesis